MAAAEEHLSLATLGGLASCARARDAHPLALQQELAYAGSLVKGLCGSLPATCSELATALQVAKERRTRRKPLGAHLEL